MIAISLLSAVTTPTGGSVVVFVDKISGADILLEQFGGSPLVVRNDARLLCVEDGRATAENGE